MNRLLLCPPDFYAIRYEINAWMNRADSVNCALAAEQWRNLMQVLMALDCEIELLKPQTDWPDMVFTANGGLVAGQRFVLANFKHQERAGEAAWFKRWFDEQGFEVVRLPENLAFEGEGDALFCGGRLFCGHGFRTDEEVPILLGNLLHCDVVSLKLDDPRFYHLDTCFCPLGDGAAIWFPDAFDSQSRDKIKQYTKDRIEVSLNEALRFACNAVVVEHDIILPDACPQLFAALHERGFRTHPMPMSEFIKAGGACKCLVLNASSAFADPPQQ